MRVMSSAQRAPADKDSVAAPFVREALAALERRGHDPAPVLEAAGVPAEVLQTPGLRISAAAFGRLWLSVAERLDDEFFGMDSRRLKVGSFATLCHLCLHTRDLREALIRGARLLNLLLDDTRIELDFGGDPAVIRFVDVSGRTRVFAHETLFVMLHGLACWLVARRIVIRRAALAYTAPERAEEYRAIYSDHIVFNQPVTQFEFSAVDLAAPVVQSEASAREFLRGAPGNFIVKYKNPRGLAAQLRRRLRGTPETWPSFEALAREQRLSLSTLRRRLEQEGTSYRLLKSAARRDLAIAMLAQPQRPVAEVATALGFAEPSAFYRAFRQWTGLSPADYRAGLRNSEPGPD